MVNMLLGILSEMWCVQYMHTRLLVTKCIVGRGVYVYPKPTEILDFKAVPYDYQLHLGTQKPLPLIGNESGVYWHPHTWFLALKVGWTPFSP